jgi:uracil permease
MKKLSKTALAFQHLLAMFGATVLVPFLTGMNPTLALLSAGLGTLTFHLITKGKVPVFLGSSFAFIGVISHTLQTHGLGAVKTGTLAAGAMYVLLSLFVRIFGHQRLKKIFPPIIVGPMIMAIGLRLSPTAISMAGLHRGVWPWQSAVVSLSVIAIIIGAALIGRSFFRLMPILFGMVGGYIIAACLGMTDFSAVREAAWFGLAPEALQALKTLPEANFGAAWSFALVALVVFMEHIGDITTNGAVVGKDFFADPGIDKTLLGDGAASAVAALVGGPPNTTYGENTGVLAITKVYNPEILRYAAVLAVMLAFLGKFGGFLQSIPQPVLGGASVILFGMIAANGVRLLLTSNLDFNHSKNLMILSVILVFGIGISEVQLGSVAVSGLTIAALTGIGLNIIMPD